MAEIVNLNRARKDKARRAARARGDANAVKFGRTKAERALGAAQRAQAHTLLDGHRRDAGPNEPDPSKDRGDTGAG